MTPWAHFRKDISIVIQIQWKFHFALIQVVRKWMLWNFAHDMTALLTWHVQNFVTIYVIKALCSKNNFPLNLNDNGKIVCEMGAWLLTILYIPFVAKIKLQTHKRHISTHDIAICPSHKSHNAPDKYPTMDHFVTEMYTHVHISVTKWCILGYETGA